MALQERDWGAPDPYQRHRGEQVKVERAKAAWDQQKRYEHRSPSPRGRWGTPDRDPPRKKKKEGWGEWAGRVFRLGLGGPMRVRKGVEKGEKIQERKELNEREVLNKGEILKEIQEREKRKILEERNQGSIKEELKMKILSK